MKYDAITIIGLGHNHRFSEFAHEVFALTNDEIRGMVHEIERESGSVCLGIETLNDNDLTFEQLSEVLNKNVIIHSFRVRRNEVNITYSSQTPGSLIRILCYIKSRV